MEFKETIYEHAPKYNSITFKSKWIDISVESADIGGDVMITIDNSGEEFSVYLTQENIQQLITHLQKQLK